MYQQEGSQITTPQKSSFNFNTEEDRPEERRVDQKEQIEFDPQVIKRVLEKLPEANELLPKLKGPIEQPNIALKISLEQLPSFQGIAPQREELQKSYSDQSFLILSKGKSLDLKSQCLSKEFQSNNRHSRPFDDKQMQSSVKMPQIRQLSTDLNQEGRADGTQYEGDDGNINNSKFNRMMGYKKFSNIRESGSYHTQYNSENQNINENDNLSSQKKRKSQQYPSTRKKYKQIQQPQPQQVPETFQVRIQRKPSASPTKSPLKESFRVDDCSPRPILHKRNYYEMNMQRYFTQLNIVYKKYAELQFEQDNKKKDTLYSSNIVEFNSVYCDVRALIRAQQQILDGYVKDQLEPIDKKQQIVLPNINQTISQDKEQEQQQDSERTTSQQPTSQQNNKISEDLNQLEQILEKEEEKKENDDLHELHPYYKLKDKEDLTLVFESRFESGNLVSAAKISDNEYDLLLQNDINTHGYTQWFFFKVSNTRAGHKVKFNIINHTKASSLFSKGMKLLVFSRNSNMQKNKGWHRSCNNILYTQNQFVRKQVVLSSCSPEKNNSVSPTGDSQKSSPSKNVRSLISNYYYTLQFEHVFEYDDDEVYFAYNYPYTYSDLQQYLNEIEDQKHNFLTRRLLCRTLAGNRIDIVTITSPKLLPSKQSNLKYLYYLNNIDLIQVIILSARVHPGETVSSFIMKGILDYLVSDSKEAALLRERFIFKIVPMLNPDGVIHGNYRCSLAGNDLNRKWKNPQKTLHPEIFYFKKMIFELASSTKVALFCDLHGHSVKKNIFLYGCHDREQPLACRELPFLLSKLHAPFSFGDCNFLVQRNKEGTARVALFQGLGIPNVFTLESSFCGPSYENIHFQQVDLETMGSRMCQAFLIYFSSGSENSKLTEQQKNLSDLRKSYLQDLWEKDSDEIAQIGMNQSAQSDSSPSEDDLEPKEIEKIFQQRKSHRKISNCSDQCIQRPHKVVNEFNYNLSQPQFSMALQQSNDNTSTAKTAGQSQPLISSTIKEQNQKPAFVPSQLFSQIRNSNSPSKLCKSRINQKRKELFQKIDENNQQSMSTKEIFMEQDKQTTIKKYQYFTNLVTMVEGSDNKFSLNSNSKDSQDIFQNQLLPLIPATKGFGTYKKILPHIPNPSAQNTSQRSKTPFQSSGLGISQDAIKQMSQLSKLQQQANANQSTQIPPYKYKQHSNNTSIYEMINSSFNPPSNSISVIIKNQNAINSTDISLEATTTKFQSKDLGDIRGLKNTPSITKFKKENQDNISIKKILGLKDGREDFDDSSTLLKQDFNLQTEKECESPLKIKIISQQERQRQKSVLEQREKQGGGGGEITRENCKTILSYASIKGMTESQKRMQTEIMKDFSQKNLKKQSESPSDVTQTDMLLPQTEKKTEDFCSQELIKEDCNNLIKQQKKFKPGSRSLNECNPLTVKAIRYSQDFSSQVNINLSQINKESVNDQTKGSIASLIGNKIGKKQLKKPNEKQKSQQQYSENKEDNLSQLSGLLESVEITKEKKLGKQGANQSTIDEKDEISYVKLSDNNQSENNSKDLKKKLIRQIFSQKEKPENSTQLIFKEGKTAATFSDQKDSISRNKYNSKNEGMQQCLQRRGSVESGGGVCFDDIWKKTSCINNNNNNYNQSDQDNNSQSPRVHESTRVIVEKRNRVLVQLEKVPKFQENKMAFEQDKTKLNSDFNKVLEKREQRSESVTKSHSKKLSSESFQVLNYLIASHRGSINEYYF